MTEINTVLSKILLQSLGVPVPKSVKIGSVDILWKISKNGKVLNQVDKEKQIYRCTECYKSFETLDALLLSCQSHTDNLKISVPDKSTTKLLQDKKFFKPDLKNISKQLKDGTKSNESVPQDCICKICNEEFDTETGLRIHIGRQHLEKPTETPIHICHICGKTYQSLRGFVKHKIVHEEMSANKKKTTTENLSYNCITCGNQFKTKNLLDMHLKMTHKEGSFYSCQSCNYQTDYKATLRIHTVQIHGYPLVASEDEDEDPFIKKARAKPGDNIFCPICNVLIKNKYYLAQHIRLHGPRNFQCTHCDKAFPGKSQLNLHLRKVHSTEKPEIPCRYCSQVFKEYRKRRRHEEKIHNVKAVSKGERMFLDDIIPDTSIIAEK